MSESLWLDLDNTLTSTVLAQMGNASSYATLKIQTVEAITMRDAWDWSTWTLPAMAVVGRTVKRDERSHGQDAISGAGPHYNKTLPYWFIAVCRASTQSLARQNAKVLESRIETMAREIARTLALQDARGERIQKKRLRESEIFTLPERTASNQWLGMAIVSMEFDSFI